MGNKKKNVVKSLQPEDKKKGGDRSSNVYDHHELNSSGDEIEQLERPLELKASKQIKKQKKYEPAKQPEPVEDDMPFETARTNLDSNMNTDRNLVDEKQPP